MEVVDYIGFVKSEGELFASAAEQGELAVAVPPCPDWDVRDLVQHLGLIHLWAAANIEAASDEWVDVEADQLTDLAEIWPELASAWPDDTDLISWYRKTHANLIQVLESKPADHQCISFLPAPTPLTMWSRRQASEIAIHRFDAEVSRGIPTHFDPQFAVDMSDELLSGFAVRPREIEIEGERVIHAHATDVDEHWYLTFGPEGIRTTREGGDADLTVSAPAADIYLLFWNRTPDSSVQLDGDTDLMDLWHKTCRIRWS